MFTELPSTIYAKGVMGELEHTRSESGFHYYFCGGRHSDTVKEIRESLGDIELVMKNLRINISFVNFLYSRYAFPEFDSRKDLLIFLNHLKSIGIVQDQDDYERTMLGIKVICHEK